ncbi:MAG: anaerobic benzoate catabolism transcriptional regulator [Gemmataceae bacterium]|nr:anaerobic benzoate catabolism transcriptional regulator [Gemmataceae bacterium]
MPQPLPALFGQLIRRRREASGLSQEDLGALTNLSRNYVGMVERGETNPTLLVLQALAVALDTTMSALIVELEAAIAKPAAPGGRPKS